MFGHYDLRLVALSISVAIAAAYAAQSLVGHVKESSGGAAHAWLFAGAMSLGTGIWSMHFIAMLALQTPIMIVYDVDRLLLSWVVSNLTALLALRVVSQADPDRRQMIIGATLLGAGITTMHYTGMSAIQIEPGIEYDPAMVIVSAAMGVGLCYGSLRLLSSLRRKEIWQRALVRLGSAVALGMAVCAMHFFGMRAAHISPHAICTVDGSTISNGWLGVVVAFGTLGVLGTTLMASIFDAHLASSTRKLNESLQRANNELARMASHDNLTGLPNRALLSRRIDQAIEHTKLGNAPFALVFVDLDGFKSINDTLGHHIGDQLLCAVAQRMGVDLGKLDTLARLGGDEFVVLLRELDDPDYAFQIADHLREQLERTFRIGEHHLSVTATFGISLYPAHGRSAQELLVSADAAMYRGKRMGRNQLQMFDPDHELMARAG